MDMYYDDGPLSQAEADKTIKAYRNGDLSFSATLRIKSNLKIKDLTREIEEKLNITAPKEFRFFNQEGLELFSDDLQYLKNGATIFISRGENYDSSSGLSEYEVIEKLGEGGFGEVDLAVHKETGEKVAIKFLKAAMVGNAKEIDTVFAEGEMLKSLNHKGIVKVLNCLTLGNMKVAFIMEYLEGGELKDYIIAREKLSEAEALEFFSQIADAVYYCHREKLIHRDLKLENILLQKKDSKIVKIVDFGICGLSTNLGGDIEAGSLEYLSPETLSGKQKGVHPGVDVWALGCILFGMVAGTLPFSDANNKKVMDKILEGDYSYPPKVEASLSREVKDLIKQMLTVDPKLRITMVEIMNHPWLLGQKLAPSRDEEFKKEEDSPKLPTPGTKPAATTKKIETGKATTTGPTTADKKLATSKGTSGSTFNFSKKELVAKDEKDGNSPLKVSTSTVKTPNVKPTGSSSHTTSTTGPGSATLKKKPEEPKKK